MTGSIGPQVPEQPSVQQPTAGSVAGTSGKGFDLSAPTQTVAAQVTPGAKSALKNFLKSGAHEYQEPNTNIYYKMTSGKDPNPPPGTKGSELVTVTTYEGNPAKGGKATGTQEFGVVKTQDKYFDDYAVYTKPGNQEDQDLGTNSMRRIPNNLGALMKADPEEGSKIYQAFIKGIAMQIMNELKKHQKMFSQAQRNA